MEECFPTQQDTLQDDADSVMQNYFPDSATLYEENWKVERILAVTEKDGDRFYKVKWSRCIWQSEESLQPIQQLLHAFWEEHSSLSLSSNSNVEEKSNNLIEETGINNDLYRDTTVEAESRDKACDLKINLTSQQLVKLFQGIKLQSTTDNNMEATSNEKDILPSNTANGGFRSENVEIVYDQSFSMSCPTKEKLFKCDTCGKSFDRKTSLQRHSLIHSGEKPWQCRICTKSFNQNSILQRHLLTHADQKSFQCDICEKTFTEKAALNRHRPIHSSEKSWSCNVCDKKFILKEYLAKHMFLHTGCKPHKCQTCERSFADNCALRRHRKVHKEKRHTCVLCGKCFRSNTSLKKHFLRCKSLCCVICGSKFNDEQFFMEHLKTHLTPYRCKQCGSEFDTYHKLLEHADTHLYGKPLKCTACPNDMFLSYKQLDDHIAKSHRYKDQPDIFSASAVFEVSNMKRFNDGAVDKNDMKVPKSFDELFKSALLP